MKIRSNGWVHRLIRERAAGGRQIERDLALYKFALENAYEGIVVADAKGYVLSASRTYASFLQLDAADMIGKHVTDVIPNTRLHIVAETGKAEIADLQQIRGHWMIASRIPIRSGGELVAVVGKIMFQDIDNLFEMNAKYKEIKAHLHYGEAKSRDASGAKYGFEHIVGNSEPIRKLKTMASKIAKSDSTVLISGESGTGKELLAHAIHRESMRRFGPFVAVNCSAIPEALFESELFGYKEGSFTGARRSGKKGKFAQANKGTIFLDEVGELLPSQQAKLLRVLQEKEIEPVGADKPEPVDARVIAATNRDLAKLVREGAFREDLFYRLHVVPLRLPPLRERAEDIPAILGALLPQLSKETGIPAEGVDAECERLLMRYGWPGNVRELRNVAERALYAMEGAVLNRAALPAEIVAAASADERSGRGGSAPLTPGDSAAEAEGTWKAKMAEFEKRLLQDAIDRAEGDRRKAAALLGMSKSSLYQKAEQYGIVARTMPNGRAGDGAVNDRR
ncbi:sigma-54 interaction domain-containing protein [Paenibacillus sp. GYB003]|uniref:sigma-54 interaction domain-containing protein n=1 Tax=Paenibacillus sp. GYB003 TaxID=2994392 RepID=UPI002F96D4A6